MKRHHEISRLEALSDAVFAFAATLLGTRRSARSPATASPLKYA
jgi:hypothetical protein